MIDKKSKLNAKISKKAPVLQRALGLHDKLVTQPERPENSRRLDRVVNIIYNNAPGN